ncbi:MAG: hypothetical protein ABIJ97_01010 [Bacteroidota bacterium]
MKYYLILILFFLTTLTSCFWGKQLDVPKNVMIEDNFTVKTDNSTSHIYINNYSEAEYKNFLMNNLKTSLVEYNINIVDINFSNIDYTIYVNTCELKETSRSEVVNDETSDYNGRSYELATCDADASFKLYLGKLSENNLVGEFSVYASKEEKLKNSRTGFDYMFGTNKDNKDYRQKLLSDDTFKDLAEKCGNRISGKATQKISKRLKKQT